MPGGFAQQYPRAWAPDGARGASDGAVVEKPEFAWARGEESRVAITRQWAEELGLRLLAKEGMAGWGKKRIGGD